MAKKELCQIDNEDEFVKAVAKDCIKSLSEEEKDYIRNNPDDDYHFGYGMYIRNHYIHGKELAFNFFHADDLSGEIMQTIIDSLCQG